MSTKGPASNDSDPALDVPDPGRAAVAGAVPVAGTARRGGRAERAIIDEERPPGLEAHVRAGSVPAADRVAIQTDRPIVGCRKVGPRRADGSSATGRDRLEGRTARIASLSRVVARPGRRSTARIGRRSIVKTGRRSTDPTAPDPQAADPQAPDPRAPDRHLRVLARPTPAHVRA